MFAFVAVRFGVVMYLEVRFEADSLETADKFVNTPFAAVRLGVAIFGEVRFAADSLETADKFVNTPFVAFMLLLTSSPVACILSNEQFAADI